MLVNKCLSSNKQELILIKFNYSNNYYYLNKLATYVYTTYNLVLVPSFILTIVSEKFVYSCSVYSVIATKF